jgi:exopolysaccharide biosynthesis polyprenyl glycosylphosphotransferase
MSIQSHVRAQSAWIVLLDVGCLLLSSILAIFIRFWHDYAMVQQYVYGHVDGWVMFFGSVIVANYLAGSYRVQYSLSRFNLLVTWIFSMSFAMFVLSVTSYAWMMKVMLGRGVLLLSVVFYSSFSLFLRLVAYRALFSQGFLMKRVVIIGHGILPSRLRNYLENPYILPQHRVVAWLDLLGRGKPRNGEGAVVDNIPVVETEIDNMCDVVNGLGADMVVLGQEQSRDLSPTYPHLRKLRFQGVEVMTPLVVAELYTGRTPLDFLDEDSMMLAGIESSWPIVWRTKRVSDIIISLLACLLLSPLIIIVMLLVKLESPRGSIFYTQNRVGQFGQVFRIYKFRTMREDAEDATGAVWADKDDPRITRVGRILRKFRLDEMPQFWNVLKGEMSLVGPRPERPEIVADLARQIPFYDEREYAMPGLTGWAQIQYPYGSTLEDAKRKLEYDLFYIKNLSISLDLQIVLRTLRIVLLGKERD